MSTDIRGHEALLHRYILHIVPNIVDRFYIALFSALKQTHCARM